MLSFLPRREEIFSVWTSHDNSKRVTRSELFVLLEPETRNQGVIRADDERFSILAIQVWLDYAIARLAGVVIM